MRAEFCLTALVYNLRRPLSILGVETTMPAVPRGKRLKCGPILAGTTHVGSPHNRRHPRPKRANCAVRERPASGNRHMSGTLDEAMVSHAIAMGENLRGTSAGNWYAGAPILENHEAEIRLSRSQILIVAIH